MTWPVFCLLGFLMGSIPVSVIIVYIVEKKDIRTIGSGNPGATNVIRSVGLTPGIAVLILDALKGVIPILMADHFLPESMEEHRMLFFLVGVCAILGHVFSPFLKFKGGKGVATSAGVGSVVYTYPFIIALLSWFIVLKVIQYMSVASIAATLVFSTFCFLFFDERIHGVMSLAIVVFITWTHRSNLNRLRQGTEPKFSFSSKKTR